MNEITADGVESYVIWVSVFVGGIFLTVNTATIICRLLLALFPAKDIQLDEDDSVSLTKTSANHQRKPKYFERSCIQTVNFLSHGVRNCKCSFSIIAKNNEIDKADGVPVCTSMECNMSAVKKSFKMTDLNLMTLLFVFCVFENILIVANGSLFDESFHHARNSNCTVSFSPKDCIVLSTTLMFRKKYIFTFLHTLGFAALSVFPVIVCLTRHTFKSCTRSLLCSIVILFSILVSRCIGFLFFPHFYIQVTSRSFLLERLFSSWMAFLSMGLGFKLAIKRKPEVSTFHSRSCCGNFNKTQCNIVMGNDSQHLKSPKKREATFKDFKPQQCRTTSDMAFGSDSFIPCVVLMKKQNTRSYNQNFNIGMMAKPPRTRRRASLDVIKEHNHLKEATKWSEIMHRRRTSLPAVLTSSKGKAMMSSVLVDTATLVEVQSTLDELANKKPSNINDFVKKLQNLLQPYKTDHVKPRQVVWLHDSGAEGSDEEIVCLSPRHVSNKRPFTRRPDWQTGQRNLFSTTTTATGLPKEVPGPVKPKRLPKIAKDKTPAGTPLDSRCGSPVSDGPVPSNIGRRRTFPNLPVILSAISSDYESCDNEESIPPITVRSKSATESSDPLLISESADTQDEHFTMQNTVATPSINDEVILEEDENHHGSEWKISELEDGHAFFNNYQEELLETVYNWNFRIFDLAQKTDCVLSQMSYKLFHDTGLFETCKIPKREFVCYMKVLENGYREIPYHNRIHAADVLHGCWFLSTQEIPGFRDHCPRFSSDSSDSDSGTGIAHTRQVNNIGHGSLAQAIPALELMALYLAAAMHDYDHPGRTNAFLVETRHPLAILYNDRSVLENHHASASWKLLYSDKNFDFLQNLDTAEWKRLRFLIVEAILATDLKKHFEILSQFNSKSQQCLRDIEGDDSDIPTRTGINWSADKDRLLVCQMVIKLADIGGPAKIKPLHITWTKAICEEFFIQGDEERKLNVPVSPFMDRERPQVAELQRTFIDNLIKPIVLSMHKTGVLAGKMPADAAIEHGGMAARTNLLLEQLKDNLSFWKVQTSADGHEEMKEAFKYALTTHSSLTRSSKRDCRRASSSLFAKLPQKVKDYCPNDDDQVTGSDDDVFDDATSEVVLNQLIPSDRDVIEVSSTEREQSPLVSSHVKSNNEKNLFRVSARDHRTQTTLSSCQSDGYKNKSDSTTLQ